MNKLVEECGRGGAGREGRVCGGGQGWQQGAGRSWGRGGGVHEKTLTLRRAHAGEQLGRRLRWGHKVRWSVAQGEDPDIQS